MKKTYNEIYSETLKELAKIFKRKVGRNLPYRKEEEKKRTRELWEKLRVPHEPLPKRGEKPMVHFGGQKDGKEIQPLCSE